MWNFVQVDYFNSLPSIKEPAKSFWFNYFDYVTFFDHSRTLCYILKIKLQRIKITQISTNKVHFIKSVAEKVMRLFWSDMVSATPSTNGMVSANPPKWTYFIVVEYRI